jgi:hypothetical protein
MSESKIIQNKFAYVKNIHYICSVINNQLKQNTNEKINYATMGKHFKSSIFFRHYSNTLRSNILIKKSDTIIW